MPAIRKGFIARIVINCLEFCQISADREFSHVCRFHSVSSCKLNIERRVDMSQIRIGFEGSISNPSGIGFGPIRVSLDSNSVEFGSHWTRIPFISDAPKFANDRISHRPVFILTTLLSISTPTNLSNLKSDSGHNQVPFRVWVYTNLNLTNSSGDRI
jgi:hypothetical protein